MGFFLEIFGQKIRVGINTMKKFPQKIMFFFSLLLWILNFTQFK